MGSMTTTGLLVGLLLTLAITTGGLVGFLLALVLGHVAMVALHHWWWRDGTLARMAGRRRP